MCFLFGRWTYSHYDAIRRSRLYLCMVYFLVLLLSLVSFCDQMHNVNKFRENHAAKAIQARWRRHRQDEEEDEEVGRRLTER